MRIGTAIVDVRVDLAQYQADLKQIERLAVKATGNADASFKKATSSTRDYTKATKDARDSVGHLDRSMTSHKRTLIGMLPHVAAVTASYMAMRTAWRSVVAGFSAGSEFEHRMAYVRAITQDLAKGFDNLTQQFNAQKEAAKEAGRTTAWTAKEAAEALKYLSMAGFDAKQGIEALGGVLKLALIGELELGRATDIVTDTLMAMGLQIKDLAKVNDVFVATITRTNTNIEMMGQAMKYVAPVAGALRYEIEDVAAMIGILAQSGIKAGIAGRNLQQALVRSSDAAKRYGSNSANLIDVLEAASRKEQEYAKRLGETAARQRIMTELRKDFGLIALKSILILKDNIDAYKELDESIRNSSGEMEKANEIIEDSTINLFKKLKSAITGVSIDVWEKYADSIKEAIVSATRWINEHGDAIVNAIENTITFAKHLTILIAIFASAYAAIKYFTLGFTLLSSSISPVLLALTACYGIAKGLIWVFEKFNKVIHGTKEATKEISAISNDIEDVTKIADTKTNPAADEEYKIIKYNEERFLSVIKESADARSAYELAKFKETIEAELAYMESINMPGASSVFEDQLRFAEKYFKELDKIVEDSKNKSVKEEKNKWVAIEQELAEGLDAIGKIVEKDSESFGIIKDKYKDAIKSLRHLRDVEYKALLNDLEKEKELIYEGETAQKALNLAKKAGIEIDSSRGMTILKRVQDIAYKEVIRDLEKENEFIAKNETAQRAANIALKIGIDLDSRKAKKIEELIRIYEYSKIIRDLGIENELIGKGEALQKAMNSARKAGIDLESKKGQEILLKTQENIHKEIMRNLDIENELIGKGEALQRAMNEALREGVGLESKKGQEILLKIQENIHKEIIHDLRQELFLVGKSEAGQRAYNLAVREGLENDRERVKELEKYTSSIMYLGKIADIQFSRTLIGKSDVNKELLESLRPMGIDLKDTRAALMYMELFNRQHEQTLFDLKEEAKLIGETTANQRIYNLTKKEGSHERRKEYEEIKKSVESNMYEEILSNLDKENSLLNKSVAIQKALALAREANIKASSKEYNAILSKIQYTMMTEYNIELLRRNDLIGKGQAYQAAYNETIREGFDIESEIFDANLLQEGLLIYEEINASLKERADLIGKSEVEQQLYNHALSTGLSSSTEYMEGLKDTLSIITFDEIIDNLNRQNELAGEGEAIQKAITLAHRVTSGEVKNETHFLVELEKIREGIHKETGLNLDHENKLMGQGLTAQYELNLMRRLGLDTIRSTSNELKLEEKTLAFISNYQKGINADLEKRKNLVGKGSVFKSTYEEAFNIKRADKPMIEPGSEKWKEIELKYQLPLLDEYLNELEEVIDKTGRWEEEIQAIAIAKELDVNVNDKIMDQIREYLKLINMTSRLSEEKDFYGSISGMEKDYYNKKIKLIAEEAKLLKEKYKNEVDLIRYVNTERRKAFDETIDLTKSHYDFEHKYQNETIKNAIEVFDNASYLFDKESKEYRTMQDMKKALQIAEIAMEIQKNIQVLSSIAAVTKAKQTIAIIEGTIAIVNQGTGDPYTAFARMAAMAAIVASVLSAAGIAFGAGGLSGGSRSQTYTPAFGQNTTVFGGENDEGSQSISHSIELLENTYDLQKFTLTGIYDSMKQLNTNITGIVKGVIRSVTTGVPFGAEFGEASNIDQAIITAPAAAHFPVASLVNRYLGLGVVGEFIDNFSQGLTDWVFGTTKTSPEGSGLYISPGNKTVKPYTDIYQKNSGAAWGLIGGSEKRYTTYGAQNPEIENLFFGPNGVYTNLKEGMTQIVEELGGDVSKVASYVFSDLKIDLQGKSSDQIAKALSEEISAVGDKMTNDILTPIITMYQEIGEGALETAIRLLVEKDAVEYMITTTGKISSEILKNASKMIELSQSLVDLAGGLDKLSESFSTFYDKFFSDYEKHINVQKALGDVFEDLNLTLPKTRDAYKDLVYSLDLNTESGRKAYVVLLNAAEAADQYYSYLEDAMKPLTDLKSTITKRKWEKDWGVESWGLPEFINWFNGLGSKFNKLDPTSEDYYDESLRILNAQYDALLKIEDLNQQQVQLTDFDDLIDSLRMGPLAPVESRESYQDKYMTLLFGALHGNREDAEDLKSFVPQYLEWMRAYGGDYQNYVNMVLRDIANIQESQEATVPELLIDTNSLLSQILESINIVVSYASSGGIIETITDYLKRGMPVDILTLDTQQTPMLHMQHGGMISYPGLYMGAERGPAYPEYVVPTNPSDSSRFLSSIGLSPASIAKEISSNVKTSNGGGVVELRLYVDDKLTEREFIDFMNKPEVIKKIDKRMNRR